MPEGIADGQLKEPYLVKTQESAKLYMKGKNMILIITFLHTGCSAVATYAQSH